jgi:predicted metal-binding transcription factor (methanogenesis marker protein 9)
MSLLLGTYELEISPRLPIQLAGFAHREGNAVEVHSPLFLKTFYFERKGKEILLFIGDVIWWDTDLVRKWRSSIYHEFHIQPDSICFHATHNHSGPQTSYSFTSLLGVADSSFLDSLEEKIIESVRLAKSNKEYVTPTLRQSTCDISVHRRYFEGNKVVMQPNLNAFVDQNLSIVTFENEMKDLKGMFIHYACHPTSTDANVISAEFPGFCCSQLQKKYKEAVIGYLQGCCGDVRPALIKDNHFFRGSLSDMERIGNQLAESVIQALEHQSGKKLEMNGIEAKVIQIPLSFQNPYSFNKDMEAFPKVLEIWKEHVAKHWKKNRELDLEMQFLQFGNELSFVCFSGEMVQKYGVFVKENIPNSLALGYCNGMVGYVPTRTQIREGGYESEDFIYYFGLPAPFQEGIEEIILHSIKNNLVGDKIDG